MNGLLAAFLVETALVTYRSVTQGGAKVPAAAPIGAPLPSTYTSVILVYGALGLLPSSLAPLPSLVGWGFVVATFLNLYTPGSANAAAASSNTLATALKPAPTTSNWANEGPPQGRSTQDDMGMNAGERGRRAGGEEECEEPQLSVAAP